MLRKLSGLLALTLLAACGATETAAPGETADVAAAAPVQATYFLTENAQAPEGAADTRGDGVMRDADNRPFTYALLGQKLPTFSAPMADGTTFDSASLDRWTVIDVWGAWCGDCVADGPYVSALDRAIAQDPDLDFLSIHVPASAARATPEEMFGKHGSLDAYFKSAGYTLPVVMDMDGSLRETLKISWTPSYLLVSPDGVVRGFRTDLSVAGGEPVKDFLRDVAAVRAEVRNDVLEIGPGGVGGIAGPVPFTILAIEAAFPGHEVVSESYPGGSTSQQTKFLVRRPGSTETRLSVEPDWTRGYVGKVWVTAADVAGPGGLRLGDVVPSIDAYAGATACTKYPLRHGSRYECVIEGGQGTFRADLHDESGSGITLKSMVYLPISP